MANWNLERWLEQIYATEADEISCSDCFDLISEYVDRELEHAALDAQMQRVHQHLAQCRVCQEEYQVLRELAAEEQAGNGPASGS